MEMGETKYIAVTKDEAELLLDSFKVTHPVTRNLGLKAASLVLEFAAEAGVEQAEQFTRAGLGADCTVR